MDEPRFPVPPGAGRADCAHRERLEGVCVVCGHCEHDVVLNGACVACGTTVENETEAERRGWRFHADELGQLQPYCGICSIELR